MNHADHVFLLRDGVHNGIWADFGSGQGAFTLALAELLGPDAELYSVDSNAGALRALRAAIEARFPRATVHYLTADFTRPLELPPLDGIVMANALHFVREKGPTLRLIREYLKESGRLVLVEYDTDRGNRWVPYPLAYPTWERLASEHGFARTRLLATRPSSFLGRFFSAVSETNASPDQII